MKMKKLWVFGTSNTAGSCDHEYMENCYTKIIHDNTNYIVKNLAKGGISFESQIRYIYYFLEQLQEKPDSILIEFRGLGFSSSPLGYMPNNVLSDMYSYLKIIIRRFEDNINNNEYANIQPLYGNTKTREEVFFNGISTRNSYRFKEEWYQNLELPKHFVVSEEIETYLKVNNNLIRTNYMFIEQRILSIYGLLLTIKNLGITPYWFFIDPFTEEKNITTPLVRDQLDSMYVGYFKNNEWLSFLTHIKLQDELLCECSHPNEKAHEMIANDLIPQLC
jgi:hypothetical protein